MVIDPHAQVVRHPLAHAFGIIVVDVARDGTQRSDEHSRDTRQGGKLHLAMAKKGALKWGEPLRHLVRPDDVVEDHLQRPGRGEGHGGLDQHREQDDDDPAPVRTEKPADEPRLATGRSVPLSMRDGSQG